MKTTLHRIEFRTQIGSRAWALQITSWITLIVAFASLLASVAMAAPILGKQGIQTATYIAGISGASVPDGVTVVVGVDGQLGTTTSSVRYKEQIQPMDRASEAILSLNPVTFPYKQELDPKAMPQFGLVAKEVEKVNRDLVARDEQAKPYTVRYEAVNAMLLNEFLKEHRKNEKQEATIAQLQKQVEALSASVKKVGAQLELGETAPRTAQNSQ